MKREEILEAARVCVCTDRNRQYGEPEDNFRLIAEMWESHLRAKGFPVSITAADVALMLVEFKVARAITAAEQKADTFIDIAGYAACGGEIAVRDAGTGNAETCVACGEVIPEGRQVCPGCEVDAG